MPVPRRFAKQRDENEQAFVKLFQHEGYYVQRLDEPADLLVLAPREQRWFLVEVKNPTTHARGKSGDSRTKRQRDLPPEVQSAIITATHPQTALAAIRASCRSGT